MDTEEPEIETGDEESDSNQNNLEGRITMAGFFKNKK